jgi:hypothetical protein
VSKFEPPKGVILNLHSVTTEYHGRVVCGTFSVWGGMLTVSTTLGSKTAEVSTNSDGARRGLARIMLRELAQEGKA